MNGLPRVAEGLRLAGQQLVLFGADGRHEFVVDLAQALNLVDGVDDIDDGRLAAAAADVLRPVDAQIVQLLLEAGQHQGVVVVGVLRGLDVRAIHDARDVQRAVVKAPHSGAAHLTGDEIVVEGGVRVETCGRRVVEREAVREVLGDDVDVRPRVVGRKVRVEGFDDHEVVHQVGWEDVHRYRASLRIEGGDFGAVQGGAHVAIAQAADDHEVPNRVHPAHALDGTADVAVAVFLDLL